jgi:branched-chain amino acid transport system permease protein
MNLGAFYAQHSRLIDEIGINALLALSLSVSLQAGQLALAQAAFAGIAAYVSAIGGAEGLSGIPNDVTTPVIYGALALVAIGLALLARTKFALAVALTREDENAARGVGVDVGFVRFASLSLGGAIAGLAGALYAHAFYFLTPADFGFPRMEAILVWCVIGGVTSPIGGVLGAVFLSVLPEVIRPLADYREFTNGIILLAVILFVPAGFSTFWSRRAR